MAPRAYVNMPLPLPRAAPAASFACLAFLAPGMGNAPLQIVQLIATCVTTEPLPAQLQKRRGKADHTILTACRREDNQILAWPGVLPPCAAPTSRIRLMSGSICSTRSAVIEKDR